MAYVHLIGCSLDCRQRSLFVQDSYQDNGMLTEWPFCLLLAIWPPFLVLLGV